MQSETNPQMLSFAWVSSREIPKGSYTYSQRLFSNFDLYWTCIGEIEHLPLGDGTVDVIISNCVINLVPESSKPQVFKDCFRVLKPGGRLCISDVVTSVVIPAPVREELKNYAGCLNGATLLSTLESILTSNGYSNIRITPKEESKEFIKSWAPSHDLTDIVLSALIEATKPQTN